MNSTHLNPASKDSTPATLSSCPSCLKAFSLLTPSYECKVCSSLNCFKCMKHISIDSSLLCIPCFITKKERKDIQISSSDSLNENMKDLLEELQANPKQEESFEKSIKTFASTLTISLLESYNEDLSWSSILIKTLFEAVETVCPSVKFRNDKMNINKYLKIIQINSNIQDCLFFRGSFIKTNYSLHMMRAIEYPKILFLDNKQKNTLEDYLKICEKLLNDSISLVLCTGDLPEDFLKNISQNGISTILDMDPENFSNLSRMTQATVLKSLSQIFDLEDYSGKCSKMLPMNYFGENFLFFVDIFDYSLGGTFILTGQNTKNIVKIMNKLMIAFRNAKLERIFLFESGSIFDDFSLIRDYSEDVWLKSLNTCRKMRNQQPLNSFNKIYKSSDQPIGLFVQRLAEAAEKNCQDCGKNSESHLSFYFNRGRLVQVSVDESKVINESSIFLSVSCNQCSWTLPPHFLSNATWEYSFSKFLLNFITIGHTRSTCGHLMFNNTFKFHVSSKKITFSVKDFPCFSLLFSLKTDLNTEYFNSLLKESLSDLQLNSKFVLDHVLDKAKDLVIKINTNIANFEKNIEQKLVLRNQVLKEIERLYQTMHDLFATDMSRFSSFLDIEAMRKALFLESCRTQVQVFQAEKKFNKILEMNKKSPDPEDFDFLIKDEDLAHFYYKFRAGNLTLPMCKAFFVPVYEDDVSSFIAYGLSSFSYYSEVILKITDFKEELEKCDCSDWTFNVSSFEGLEVKEKYKKLYGNSVSFSLTCFNARLFHSLREVRQISNESFILSLSRSLSKKEEIGKSSAIFRQSHDHRFLIKIINQRDLKMSKSISSSYFSHQFQVQFKGKASILNVCLGVFKISLKNSTKSQFVMVFDKVGYGFQGPNVVYDLKGTLNKRRKVKQGDSKTKMDLNFLEDFNSLPLPVTRLEMEKLSESIHNDSIFLKSCNVIDYSLLLIINITTRKVALGIIDYQQQYTLDKILENTYKTVVGSEMPTVVDPGTYQSRFFETILTKFFMSGEE